MHFLFRAPLFDFDPSNEKEIEKHWEEIKTAIEFSSSSLFQAISGKKYGELKPFTKAKVFKYILRGRYRATPFGKLAAVGTGQFSNHEKYGLDLSQVSPIPARNPQVESKNDPSKSYYLAEGGFEKLGRVHFLSYLPEDQRWAMVSVPKNKILCRLIKKLKSGNTIQFDQFKSLFDDSKISFVTEIWEQMIELGILTPGQHSVNLPQSSTTHVDLVFNDGLTLPNETLQQLKDFGLEAGNLFIPNQDDYISCLIPWFQKQFDDRFIPITLLMEHIEFIGSSFLNNPSFEASHAYKGKFKGNLWESESIDLRNLVAHQPIDKNVFDLQVVFKWTSDCQILIENMVCNRPFIYHGRFNKDASLFKLQKSIKENIYTDKEVIYAEIRVTETEAIQRICSTQLLFDRYITPFQGPNPKAIQLKEILIGHCQGQFLLIHKETGKRIIPVVMHPLNGKEISHPILRLLWELDHQNSFRFISYTYPGFQESNYIPELKWDKLILQSRRWIIHHSNYSNIKALGGWLNRKNIPSPIIIGIIDRELVLNWRKEDELEILWRELIKFQKVVLSECKWLGNSPFQSQNRNPVYPQFVVHISQKKQETPFPNFVNTLDSIDRTCLYLLIRTREEDCWESLEQILDHRLLSFLEKEKIQWYYLLYPEGESLQLRIRFLRLSSTLKKEILARFCYGSRTNHSNFETRPYYPETQKYGKESYRISEDLFCLESSFLWHRNKEKNEFYFQSDDKIKLELILVLWTGILNKLGKSQILFNPIKQKVKAIPQDILKELKIKNETIKPEVSNHSNHSEWIEKYTQVLLTHPLLYSEDKRCILLILNHIHMQTNRFFGSERGIIENLVYLNLYKVLGKEIYGKRSN
ncbi:lantibiotic dehydratase [Algoriphagus sp. CAU 1675]|uniref:lantibiotic dehydratase n=1 Tax=Algoriphagus sp. CAU 1675 TaxID=3032597 RepID=UPI0023D98E00|nr:lantibiotic dehydratase [Algoriphagus sp. CAU 1675]MDF2159435.1 lantibiotic dehydratase [Algoriphagus sp. CAU 1675]